MIRVLTLTPTPGTQPPPAPMVAVDRATAEIRRGGAVVIRGRGSEAVLVLAAEAVTPTGLMLLSESAGGPVALAITGRRATVLGLGQGPEVVMVITAEGPFDVEMVRALAQPDLERPVALPPGLTATSAERGAAERGAAGEGVAAVAAVRLTKLARLLPAAMIAHLRTDDAATWAERRNLVVVEAEAILGYDQMAARSLRPVSEAVVPLAGAESTRIIAFRPGDGGIEHLAIVIGEPDEAAPVLTRLHSECFTGDLLGSLRCDCGDQLRGAIEEIARAGSGVLLYLAQEGRGIGLVNKLRAYQLQDRGFDTLDANGQLGFDDDERIYLPAAEMLRQLGFSRVRLLTNNPRKVDSLARHDIEVVERVPHVFPANDHNQFYLRTKATRGGHLF
ncbi:MAG: GTP cyclohydrolase II [Alphaproteobacteria bacterium]